MVVRRLYRAARATTHVCVGGVVGLDDGTAARCYWRVGAEACGGGGGTRDTVVVAARMAQWC